jgi:large subunit ribosomal protein L15
MLDRLQPRPGARHKPKRVGRGPGTGHQKTAGRGTKGQGKRSPGRETPFQFEGGQMPLTRRIPKRGFTNIHREPHGIVNLGDLVRFGEGATIEPATLVARGLVKRADLRIKLLGEGEPPARATVRVHAASASAKSKLEAAGGTLEILE